MSKIQYRKYTSIGEAISLMLKNNGLSEGLRTTRIYSAWDEATGAAQYTVNKYFKDGKLYITVNSSVLRSQLTFQKFAILEKINRILSRDKLLNRDSGPENKYVKELIIK